MATTSAAIRPPPQQQRELHVKNQNEIIQKQQNVMRQSARLLSQEQRKQQQQQQTMTMMAPRSISLSFTPEEVVAARNAVAVKSSQSPSSSSYSSPVDMQTMRDIMQIALNMEEQHQLESNKRVIHTKINEAVHTGRVFTQQDLQIIDNHLFCTVVNIAVKLADAIASIMRALRTIETITFPQIENSYMLTTAQKMSRRVSIQFYKPNIGVFKHDAECSPVVCVGSEDRIFPNQFKAIQQLIDVTDLRQAVSNYNDSMLKPKGGLGEGGLNVKPKMIYEIMWFYDIVDDLSTSVHIERR